MPLSVRLSDVEDEINPVIGAIRIGFVCLQRSAEALGISVRYVEPQEFLRGKNLLEIRADSLLCVNEDVRTKRFSLRLGVMPALDGKAHRVSVIQPCIPAILSGLAHKDSEWIEPRTAKQLIESCGR
ncbi:hypothetical protein AU191_06670 [Mycolicibacterium acapulense]|nr:hypothetical protein AU191_06670 [Mycolicibacterium acapulense]